MRSRIHILFCSSLTSFNAPFCGILLRTKRWSLVCAHTSHWVRPLTVLRTLVASALSVGALNWVRPSGGSPDPRVGPWGEGDFTVKNASFQTFFLFSEDFFCCCYVGFSLGRQNDKPDPFFSCEKFTSHWISKPDPVRTLLLFFYKQFRKKKFWVAFKKYY